MSEKKNGGEATATDLRTKLENELKALKTTCKDAAFFDSQIDRILSLKGQIDTKPVRLIIEESDVIKEYKGDTFYIAITNRGALFHVHGGYNVFVENRNDNSLYYALEDMVDTCLDNTKLTEKERQDFEVDMQAKLHILLCPTWAFTNPEPTYDIATAVIRTLRTFYDKVMSESLQDEDFKKNDIFENAAISAERIGEAIRKEKEEGNA